MKKYSKTMIIVAMMAVAALVYYYYLSNKTPSQDATQQSIANEEIAALTTRDISANYPESPKEVVKLYVRIVKQYYDTELTNEQIESLGKQARLLFDDELKSKQTETEFLDALKTDISSYRSIGRKISDYTIDSSSNVDYKTLDDKKYASLVVLYYIRENNNLNNSYTKFTLRQDNNGKWKILFWEVVNS